MTDPIDLIDADNPGIRRVRTSDPHCRPASLVSVHGPACFNGLGGYAFSVGIGSDRYSYLTREQLVAVGIAISQILTEGCDV